MAIARNNNLSKSAKFFDSDGALNLVEGSNITITKSASAGTITIASTASGGGTGTVDSAFVLNAIDSALAAGGYLDSTTVQGVIDGTYIQANQTTYNTSDFPDSAGVIALITANETTYTNVSEFVNDANYLDSTTVQGVINSTYIQANQTTYNTSDFVDSAYVTTQINNLIGAAPGTLDTLEEIAAALNNDSNAYGTLVALINETPDSAWITALPISTFSNDVQYLDSTTVQGVVNASYIQSNQTTYNTSDFLDSSTVELVVDASYVQARQTTYSTADFLDSYYAVALIDSAHVQLRQDKQYSSLTGAPTALSSFANDTQYLDSTTVQYVINAAYIQSNQTTYTNVSEFVNDANYLDSTTVQGVVNSTYIQANQTTYNTSDFPDSAGVTTLANSAITSATGSSILAYDANLQGFVDAFTLPTTDGATNHVLLTNGTGTLSFASVASVSGATDSGDVRSLIDEVVDSTFVALHQDYAYANLTGAPTNVTSFVNDANYLDSTTVQGVINSSYIQSNQTTYNTSDFLDSTTVYPLFSAGTGVTYNGSGQFSIGQGVNTSDSVTFLSVTTTGDIIVGGNLQVTGTTTTVNSEDLNVTDNMIYMNAGESSGSPTASIDVGWAANVNDDGSYAHVGMFRDATDNTFKVFHQYTPEPDAAVEINTGHASFALAPFAAYSLTGKYLGFDSDAATTNISTFINDVKYLDSTTVQGVINATYIQANQTTYTNVSEFVNDANYLDSTTVQGVINAAYIQANQTTYDFLDSAEAIALIDSDYVRLRQDKAYASLTGAPTNVSSFVNDANYLDSTTVQGVINSSYIQSNQTTYSTADFLDSYYAIALIDSAYVQARQAEGATTDPIFKTIRVAGDSDIVADTTTDVLTFAAGAGITLSTDATTDTLTITANNNVDLTNYHYVATADQTTFSGNDIAGNSLTYTTGNVQVFKNGILLIDSDDYTATSGNSIVLSAGARVGDTVSISNYGSTAGSINLRDSADGIAVTAALSVEGAMYVNGSVEKLIDKSSATGTVTHDFSEGALFYHSSISSNFAVNLTNFPTANGKAIVVSLILDQGATAYIPNALQVGGVAQTINWFGGSTPSGNANKKDLVAFTLIRRSGSWTVLGQLSSFG